MKKIIALILALTMALSLCACAPAANNGGANDSGKTDSGKTDAGEEIVIEIWMTGADAGANAMNVVFDQKVKEFEAKYDNVKFDVSYIGEASDDYTAKWAMAAQANNFPDIFYSSSGYAADWAKAGLLADFGPELLGDEEFVGSFQSGALESSNELCGEGTLYCVPSNVEAQGWVYNLDLFEQCGLEVPETYDDLLNCIKVFKENGITPILHGGVDKWAIWGYHSFFSRYGLTYEDAQKLQSGELKFADCKGITGAFNKFESLAKAGAFNEDAYTTTHANAWALFLNGQGAMYTVYDAIGASVEDKSQIENVRFGFGPEFSDGALDGPSGLRMYGWAYLMGAKAKESPEKAAIIAEFLKFTASPEYSQAMVDEGLSPATVHEVTYPEKSGYEMSVIDAYGADIIPTTDSFVYWFDQGYSDVYYNAVTGVLLGQMTAEEGVQMLQDFCDSNL